MNKNPPGDQNAIVVFSTTLVRKPHLDFQDKYWLDCPPIVSPSSRGFSEEYTLFVQIFPKLLQGYPGNRKVEEIQIVLLYCFFSGADFQLGTCSGCVQDSPPLLIASDLVASPLARWKPKMFRKLFRIALWDCDYDEICEITTKDDETKSQYCPLSMGRQVSVMAKIQELTASNSQHHPHPNRIFAWIDNPAYCPGNWKNYKK